MRALKSLLIAFALLLSSSVFSQDNITVTSSCGWSTTYAYMGLSNGKPFYKIGRECSEDDNSIDCDNNTLGAYMVEWTGSRWEYRRVNGACIWLVQLCVPKDDYNLILATHSTDTYLPPCIGWVPEPGGCAPVISTGCNCSITDKLKVDTTFCHKEGVVIETSETGLNYYLRKASDNSIVDGPVAGTAATIALKPGNINAATLYNVFTSRTVDSAGCNMPMTGNITVLPPIDITVTNNEPTLTANAINATYQWLDCDNNYSPINGETNQSFTASVSGNYAVKIGKDGCVDTSLCESVNINVTSIKKNGFGTQLRFAPNPTKGSVTITLGHTYSNVLMIIKNTVGQEVQKTSINSSNQIEVTLEGKPGIYFIEIVADGKKAFLKAIKE